MALAARERGLFNIKLTSAAVKLGFVETLALVFRNLKARPVRSALTLAGIIVATASMVLFLSFGEGLRKALSAEMEKFGPQIRVVAEDTGVFSVPNPELNPEVYQKLKALAPELGLTRLFPNVVLMKGSGFDPATTFLFYGLTKGTTPKDMAPDAQVVAGRLDPYPNGAVVGKQKAEAGGLKIGKTLRLSRGVELPVVGIFDAGGGLADSFIFVPIDVLQKVLNTQNYSVIHAYVAPGRTVDEVAREIERRIPGVDAQSTTEAVKYAERAIKIGDVIRFGISLISLVVGGLLVANTVMMSVYERIREFGVMRAIGARRRFIFRLVLLEALLLAVLGGTLGVILGIVGSQIVNLYTTEAVGLALSAVTSRLVLFSLAIALTLGMVAGLIPARVASRIPVVEALGRV